MLINISHYNNWEITCKKDNAISLEQLYNERDIFGIDICYEDEDSNIPTLINGYTTGIATTLRKLIH